MSLSFVGMNAWHEWEKNKIKIKNKNKRNIIIIITTKQKDSDCVTEREKRNLGSKLFFFWNSNINYLIYECGLRSPPSPTLSFFYWKLSFLPLLVLFLFPSDWLSVHVKTWTIPWKCFLKTQQNSMPLLFPEHTLPSTPMPSWLLQFIDYFPFGGVSFWDPNFWAWMQCGLN